ncbi:hypothetical protein OEZ85_011092 [Tetradesmus obliquus]|uniref:RapA2 cadherin-like domain-containing protein n=1 Tax=Tetradesmus obliquus TaxID=3088 RepID=A0ABY8TP78_TETOB|nr:hypothetical protein OEZ85_011092 [Tetradesmus obliquus]
MWSLKLWQDIVAEPIQISAVASSNQTVDFPRVHGQNGDLLTVSLSDSCSLLKYGRVEQISDWQFVYTPIAAAVPAEGAVEYCNYTIADGATSIDGLITIITAANTPPYAFGPALSTTANREATVYHQREGAYHWASDPDGDPLTVTRIGTAKYGTVSTPQGLAIDKPIVYKPDPALIKDPSRDLLDSFSYSVSDGRGGNASNSVEITIQANKAPIAANVYVPEYPEKLRRNHSLLIDLRLSTANESSYPVADPDNDALSVTVDTSTLQYGTLVQLGDGLYNYTASPGVNGEQLQDTATYTVTDGRGGSATGQIFMRIAVNTAPALEDTRYLEVATFSGTPVVIAPLAIVVDHDLDDNPNLAVVNFSTPQYGKLELISCCNNENVTNPGAFFSYEGSDPKQVADYRYTPNPDRIPPGDAVSELLQFTVTDGNGGFLTSSFNLTIYSPACKWELYGTSALGFWVDYWQF